MNLKYLRSMDPYQVLFPLGLAHAIIGALLWILFAFNLSAYPIHIHASHMVEGFLLSFATGFLLTAIPRFTGTKRCSLIELLIPSMASIFTLFKPSSLAALVMLLSVTVFILRRFRHRTYSPPPYFIFLPTGLILGLVGATGLSLVELNLVDFQFEKISKVFIYYGMMLSFLLGIGAKLISALLGWVPPRTHQIESFKDTSIHSYKEIKKWGTSTVQVILFTASFIVEVSGAPSFGRALRAACATWIGMQLWCLYRLPKAHNKLAFWIWISSWILLIGLWIHSLIPSLDIHAAHLIFIGGFGLMTLLVASRVSLAHGGYSLEIETRSRIFAVTSILILLGALTRLSVQWTTSVTQHLAYAASLWILALLFWGSYFLPKIVLPSNKNTLH